jgi:D-psicose/D-tagatose/L-ribulose 3-epimerase
MRQQHFEESNSKIQERFRERKKKSPEQLKSRLKLSWSNWGFGREPLAESAARLEKSKVPYIELNGNHYGPDLGYKVDETLRILGNYGLKVSGVCGMFSADNDLACNRAVCRQAALDYLDREVPFTRAVGGSYLLVVPGAVGRPKAYDNVEFERSAETLGLRGDLFVKHGVKAAIEPIRSAETSLVHTVADARRYLAQVNHPGVGHINGDVYHMQSEERHIGDAILDAGDQLANLHFADSNRSALGEGSLDVCTIIRALYVIGYNEGDRFVTFEPLGPGGDPYPAMHGKPDKPKLDVLVETSIRYFRDCEEMVLSE